MSQVWKLYIVLLLPIAMLGPAGCTNEAGPGRSLPLEVISAKGIEVPVYDFQAFKPLLEKRNDSVYVYNFWATWCKPCVKEMPYFVAADSAFADMPVRIVLVSLDFTEDARIKLIPFIIDKGVQTEVVLLDDMDANNWIPQVSPDWEGDIPATLFIKGDKRFFKAGSYTYKELENQITKLLNN